MANDRMMTPMRRHGQETSPAVDEKGTDQVGNQRKEHLRRESCIRVAGIFGLILAGYAVLTFVLVPLSELYDPESLGEEGSEPWMYRRWVARTICDILIALLAFVTSWGLIPATELGTVDSDDRDDATSSGSPLRLALAESHCKPRTSRESRSCWFDSVVSDVSTILPAPAFPHVVSEGQDGILA